MESNTIPRCNRRIIVENTTIPSPYLRPGIYCNPMRVGFDASIPIFSHSNQSDVECELNLRHFVIHHLSRSGFHALFDLSMRLQLKM
jgi:hypothetical protein